MLPVPAPETPPRRPLSVPPSPSVSSPNPFDTPTTSRFQLPINPSHTTPASLLPDSVSTTTADSPDTEVITVDIAERNSSEYIYALDLATSEKDKEKGRRDRSMNMKDTVKTTSPTSGTKLVQRNGLTNGSSRPLRPSVAPLTLNEDDEGIEEMIDQSHPLSAFKTTTSQLSSPASQRSPNQIHLNLDQSYWRWSNATSSVAQTEQNPFQSPPAPSSTYASSGTTQPPEQDKSFLRMTRTTIFSDFSAPSTVPDIPDPTTLPIPFLEPSNCNGMTLLSAIPESAIIPNQRPKITHYSTSPANINVCEEDDDKNDGKLRSNNEKRSSAGTFGYKNPRSSMVTSLRSNSYEISQQIYPRINPFQASSPPPVKSQLVNIHDRSKTSRPLSMSSAGGETIMSDSAYSGRALDDTALEARKALGVFTPPKGKVIHKHQETEVEINNYLKKASEINERRIMPTDICASPPKNGMKSAVELDEENEAIARKMQNRGSKIERMLGKDAEYARTTMEIDRKAIASVIEQNATPSSLPPPLRAHKASASNSNVVNSLSPTSLPRHNRSHTVAQAESLASPVLTSHTNSHLRSSSIDSLPSLHPSISDSVNTLSGLISSTPSKLKQDDKFVPSTKINVGRFTDIQARNDLTPEQRAILLRRTKKLEQMLGEALPENQVEKLVIEPVNTGSTYMTKNSEDAWPKTPPSSSKGGRRTPEWERDDCIPNRIKDSSSANQTHSRSKSSLADKAKAALGLGPDRSIPNGGRSDEGKDHLKVYVSRSLQESHTVSRGNPFNGRSGGGINRQSNSPPDKGNSQTSSPTTPGTATTMGSSNWPGNEHEEETIRKNRRLQLAKLHRLLGTPIPPELLNPSNPTSPSFASRFNFNNPSPQNHISNRSPSPSESSYISFEDTTTPSKWSSRLKVPINSSSFRKRGNSSPAQLVADNQSFIDFDQSKSKGSLSKEEKSLARKRAAKLEYVLGDKPPTEYVYRSSQYSTLPSPRLNMPQEDRSKTPTPSTQGSITRLNDSIPTDNRGSAYDAYSASLEGLLYLVENDQSRLGEMMDSLSNISPPTSPKRSSPHTNTGNIHRHNHSDSRSFDSSIIIQNPPSPLIDTPQSPTRSFMSVDNTENDDFLDFDEPDSPSRADKARRRRTAGKLTQFCGESINSSISPPPPPPPKLAKTRIETLDGILNELWKNIQLLDIKKGEIKKDEKKNLENLLDLLNNKSKEKNGWMGSNDTSDNNNNNNNKNKFGIQRQREKERPKGGKGNWEMI
ncbi:uncharacterized protein L201_005533 [Kwoniella dendrophila CBS 6074]|uniref:Uncharacterized protein n=1 Tax=Kwoniella dendrophila CBS 6074 TaxID=1295534 RepID=A0AAX4K111_9TREE